jgi:hypothetical protein
MQTSSTSSGRTPISLRTKWCAPLKKRRQPNRMEVNQDSMALQLGDVVGRRRGGQGALAAAERPTSAIDVVSTVPVAQTVSEKCATALTTEPVQLD